MSILSFLLGEKKKTASVAKERLQIILAHERSSHSAPADYLPALQRELVAVISKYVKIGNDDIKVNLERQDNLRCWRSRSRFRRPEPRFRGCAGRGLRCGRRPPPQLTRSPARDCNAGTPFCRSLPCPPRRLPIASAIPPL